MSVIPELVELTDAEIDAVAGGCIAPGLDGNTALQNQLTFLTTDLLPKPVFTQGAFQHGFQTAFSKTAGGGDPCISISFPG
jgi:hypothetical protein